MQSRKFVNKLKSVVSIIVIMAMFILMGRNNVVYASSATVTISSATVTQGQEFKVNVDISADANIGAYNFYLEYDASVLQAVSGFEGGGGGRIQLIYDVPDSSSISKKLTKTVTFKAIGPGTSAIKYVCISGDDGVIDYDTVDNMSVTPKNGSITVNAPVVASKNNNLSSMSIAAVREDGSSYDVTLSPAFSKDVTKYNISVEQGVTDLVVSAKTEDAKAKINVQWPNLDPGDNTTKVIVTAEDGSKKEYVIYTKVPVEETTPPMPEDPITTVIDGTEYYVGNINDSVTLPEGFESFEYNYNGKTVVAGKGLVKDIIVMYLTSGTGEAGKLYIYDEVANSFYPMVNITMSQKLYTIVKAPEELVVPVGYNESVITIDGVEFTGWQISELEGIYLVYAMNWEGQAGLYYYDIAESQMMKYFDSSVEVGVELDDYNSLVSENESLKDDIAKLKETNVDGGKVLLYKYVIFIALFLVVILIGVIIVLVVKKNKDDADDEEERNDAIDSAFANIISKEEAEAAAQVEDDLEENDEENDEESAEETEVEETVEVSVLPEVLPEVSEEEIAEDIEQCEEATEDTEIEENMDEMADLEDVMDEIDDIIEEEFELREALKENSETVESKIETVR
ncbi:MAG: cadherin-like beta sandwich domain-containing protein, partial [Lachnospiraceae bacterium]|nr:cadherin-like beta sandwich domain-containing protein [Lachnospiraceae bacterium]